MKRIIASLSFFTRLPFWRIATPSKEDYTTVVELWPLVGWFTSLTMAGTMLLASQVFPWTIAVLAGIAMRLFITGALHEDGLADFADGFGGGTDRQRTLDIMKDSHIGTYGVLALIIYFATLYSILVALPPYEAMLLVVAGDPYAKMLSAQITQMLPYARTEEQAKSHILYRKMSTRAGILLFIQGILPMAIVYLATRYLAMPLHAYSVEWLLFLPCLTMYAMYRLMHRRIQGYTGDCCGALFLLTELSFYLAWMV